MSKQTQADSSLSIDRSQLTLGGDEIGNAAALDKSLASFAARPPLQGLVNSGSSYPESAQIIDDPEEPQLPELPSPTEDPDSSEPPGEEDSSDFDIQFKERFGLEPSEAVETINSLVAFKSEMQLMREWGVSPSDYDGRMGAVKEFYKTLPEDKQAEFNTVEGAKAIWSHLEKTTPKAKSTSNKVGSSRKSPTSTAPITIKKSEILKMDNASYAARLPEITKAWREGRVIEDV